MAEKLKEILYDGNKVITEAAKRDSQGNVIKDTYAKSENVYSKDEIETKLNEVKSSFASADLVYSKDDVDQKISSVESKMLKFVETDTLPEEPNTSIIYIINGEQKVYTDGSWMTIGTTNTQTFKTINGESILGEGNIEIKASSSETSSGASFKLVEVDVLPAVENAKEGTIYLIKKSDSVYEEYVLFNNALIPFGSTNSTITIAEITETLKSDVDNLNENYTKISSEVSNINLDNYYTKADIDDGYGDFIVNGKKVALDEGEDYHEVVLLAQASYEISGRLNGHLIIDGSGITDSDNFTSTNLKLNNVYICSDTESAILYTGKYKTLKISMPKGTVNYIKCEQDDYESEASKAAAIYAQEITETITDTSGATTTNEYEGNIDISGNGSLIIISKGYHSHGIKADEININGKPNIYISTGTSENRGHDGIHAASMLNVYNGIFVMENVNDVFGTGDSGQIYYYNGEFNYRNISGTVFDCGSDGDGYFVGSGTIQSNDDLAKFVNDIDSWSLFTPNSESPCFSVGQITLNNAVVEPTLSWSPKRYMSITNQTSFTNAINNGNILGTRTMNTISNDDGSTTTAYTYSKVTEYNSSILTYYIATQSYDLSTAYDNTDETTKLSTKYFINGYINANITCSGKGVRVVLNNCQINGAIKYTNEKKKLTIEVPENSMNSCKYISSTNNITITSDIRGALYLTNCTGNNAISGSTVSIKGDGVLYATYRIYGTEILFGEEASDDDIYIPEDLTSNSEQNIYVESIYARLNTAGDKKGSIVFYPNQSGSIVANYIDYDVLETYDKNGIHYDENFNKDNLIIDPFNADFIQNNPSITLPQNIIEKNNSLNLLSSLTPMITGDAVKTLPATCVFYIYSNNKIIDYVNAEILLPVSKIKFTTALGYSETLTNESDIYDCLSSYFFDSGLYWKAATTYYICIDDGQLHEVRKAYDDFHCWYYLESFVNFGMSRSDDDQIYLTMDTTSTNVYVTESYINIYYEIDENNIAEISTNSDTTDSHNNLIFIEKYLENLIYYGNISKYHYQLQVVDDETGYLVNIKYGGFDQETNILSFVLEKSVNEIYTINMNDYTITKTIESNTSDEDEEVEKNLPEVIDIPIGIEKNSSTGNGDFKLTLKSTDVFDELCAQYFAGTIILRAKYTYQHSYYKTTAADYFNIVFINRGNTGGSSNYNNTHILRVVAPNTWNWKGYFDDSDYYDTYNISTSQQITYSTVYPRYVNVTYDNTLTTSWKEEY